MTKEEVMAEAMKLPAADLEQLAEELWQRAAPGELSEEQVAEVRRRIEAVDRGEASTIAGGEVMREVRGRYGR